MEHVKLTLGKSEAAKNNYTHVLTVTCFAYQSTCIREGNSFTIEFAWGYYGITLSKLSCFFMSTFNYY